MNAPSTSAACLLALAISIIASSLSTPASAIATTAPASQPSIATLRAAALADDIPQSIASLRQLAAAGEPGRQSLRGVLPLLLTRDAATLEPEAAAASAQLPKLRAAEAEIEPLRAAQLDAIANLTHDAKQLLVARHNYDKLSAVQARLAAGYAHPLRVLDVLARRSECLALTQPGDPVPTSAANGDRIDRLAEQCLGMPPAAAQRLYADPLRPPTEPAQRPLWFYLSCRRIEAWNRTIEPALNAGEIAHARRLNFYRELLGLLPYELDLRLTQSARRHSREMIDLWYFSHYSPTESERSPFARMDHAGYPNPTGENLQMGRWTGEEAFWNLFNSPSHHREWTDPNATAVGIGKWENAWTEDFGSAPRLMTATPGQQAKAMVRGEVLKPQPVELTRHKPRDMRDIKFYDESGHEIPPPTPGAPNPAEAPGPAAAAKPTPGTVEMKAPTGKTSFRWQPAGPATEPATPR